MQVHTAQLPGPDRSQDRVFTTTNAAIVLDGATAFAPTRLDAGTYADTLGRHIAAQLRADDRAPLTDVVSRAIDHVARRYDLRPGRSPSSTVTILRVRDQRADLYALGDSPLHYGTDNHAATLVDTRLAELDLPERQHYRSRLRHGARYDEEHRALLHAMQERQSKHRNIKGGYWIAEADPVAAHHAVTARLSPEDLSWAVLATDGITNPLSHLGHIDWAAVATSSDDQLAAILADAHRWERDNDPSGQDFPRAKRHDDKAIAVIPSVWQ